MAKSLKVFMVLCFSIMSAAVRPAELDAKQRLAGVSYEESGQHDAASCLILLHGVSGVSQPLYRQQASYFAAHGFRVLLPHYFDATHSSATTVPNYRIWAKVVGELVAQCHALPLVNKVYLVGYSLGASVALVAGSQGVPVDAIADWYGSLPDEFFYEMVSMPPLLVLHGERDTNIPIANGQQLVRLCEVKELPCEHHFFPNEGHGFSDKALREADERTLAFFRSFP